MKPDALTPFSGPVKFRALIVNGDVAERGVLSNCLTEIGMSVSTADSGEDAVVSLRNAAFEGRPFAVAFLAQSIRDVHYLELRNAIVADPAITAGLVIMVDPEDDFEYDLERNVDAEPAVQSQVCVSLPKSASREDVLSCMRSTLGLEEADMALAVVAQLPSSSGHGSDAGRLLLAEDNLINQKVVVAMLSNAGYRVDTVLNGAEAVKAVAAEAYDAVLMDCQMPDLNGYEATAAIRALKGSARFTPIIAVTAGAREEDSKRCLDMGMDAYISKPVSKGDLVGLVGRIIQNGAANQASINPVVLDRSSDSVEREDGDRSGNVIAHQSVGRTLHGVQEPTG
jgi:CheY-like chemotaxis protein